MIGSKNSKDGGDPIDYTEQNEEEMMIYTHPATDPPKQSPSDPE